MHVLHIIERLTLGGPSRTLIALVKYSAREDGVRHSVASLLPPEAGSVALAEAAGLSVLGPMDGGELDRRVGGADIVQVHFWNSARLYQTLEREWRPARVVCWCHVTGDAPAQVLTARVAAFSDVLLATGPSTVELPVFREAPPHVAKGWVLASTDFERVGGVERRAQRRFTVGYLGTVDFVKMHPDFAAMHAAIGVPDLRVVVCGAGPDLDLLRRQVARLGCPERFEFRGRVEAVGEALAEFDVFGYPLHPETYATAELALQEAMYAGVPPVVLSRGSPGRIVHSGGTGLVVSGPAEYAEAVARLHRDSALRCELGAGAAAYARTAFGAEKMARSFGRVYRDLMGTPKRSRPPGSLAGQGGPGPRSGARCFIDSLDSQGEAFSISLRAETGACSQAEVLAADNRIAASSPLMLNGGILNYRLHHPLDPHLRFWGGLMFQHQNRPALAAAEFRGAIALGLDQPRVRQRLGALLDSLSGAAE